MGVLAGLYGTFWGGLLVHSFMIPSWTLSPIPLFGGPALTLFGLHIGRASYVLVGAALIVLILVLNNYAFAYRPWLVRLIYDLDMSKYYGKCEIGGALSQVRTSNTLFMFHPHGVLSVGFVVNGCWGRQFNALAAEADLSAKPSGTLFLIAHNLRAWSAFFKVMCDVSGRLESATKQNIHRFMAAGRNLAIIPGGFEDATLHAYGEERTFLNERKGLIKYALQHGYALTPVYTFGEAETYRTFTPLLRQRLALNRHSIPGVLFWGDWRFPLFPRRESRCVSYLGPPLQLPRIDEPTPAQVDAWHASYVRALRQVFDRHKAEAGKPKAELQIF